MFVENLADVIGFVGVGLYLGAYFLLQTGFLRGQTYSYATLNLIAASCVLYDLQESFNLSSVLIQVSWIAISLVGMIRLALLARKTAFSPEERRFLEAKLPGLPRHSARRLLDAGRWVDAKPGAVLVRENEPTEWLVYLAEGRAQIRKDGHLLTVCEGNTLLGELSVLDNLDATATAVLETSARYFAVGAETLRRLARRDADLDRALRASITGDARQKLVAANDRQRRFEAAAPASVDSPPPRC